MASTTSFAADPSGAKPKPFITWERFVVYSVLIVCALFFLLPLYIMIITSLKSIPEGLFRPVTGGIYTQKKLNPVSSMISKPGYRRRKM